MNKKSLTWFTLGSLASSSLSFISIPIVAWFFPSEEIGKAALLISMAGLGSIIFALGMDQSFTREFNEAPNKSTLLLSVILPGAVIFLITSALLLLIAPDWPSSVLFDSQSVGLSIFIVYYLYVVVLSRFLTLYHRMREDGMRYALSFLLAKISFVALICLAYFKSSPGLEELLIAHGVSVSIGLLYLLFSTRKTWMGMRFGELTLQRQRSLLAFGLPTAASGMLFWGLEGVDKFMLRTYSSYTELGIYSVVLSISAMATVLTSMFTTIWIPVVYRWVSEKKDLSNIDKVTDNVLAAVVFIVGLAGAFGWVLRYLLPEAYESAQDMIAACMLWPLFYGLSEATGLGIAIKRSTVFSLVAAAAALLVNVCLNFLLLSSHGSRGAAVSLAVAIWTFFIFRTEISRRIWRDVPYLGLYLWTAAALALAVVHALAGPAGRSMIILGWAIYLIVAVVQFRTNIVGIGIFAISAVKQKIKKLVPGSA